jgi:hypothetical protein
MRALIALSLIGLLTVPVTQAAARERAAKVETHSLHVPDEVSPAVEPYLQCRLQSLGATINDKDGNKVAPLVEKGGDCSALRAKAATDADAMLVKAGKAEADRTAMVQDTLKSIDDFADVMRKAMAGTKAKSS